MNEFEVAAGREGAWSREMIGLEKENGKIEWMSRSSDAQRARAPNCGPKEG